MSKKKRQKSVSPEAGNNENSPTAKTSVRLPPLLVFGVVGLLLIGAAIFYFQHLLRFLERNVQSAFV